LIAVLVNIYPKSKINLVDKMTNHLSMQNRTQLWYRLSNISLAVMLQCLLPVSGAIATNTKIKVMSLGDSLCAGNISDLRSAVAQTKFGSNIDWVGTKKDGAYKDPDNECHGGWSAAQVLQKPGAKVRLPAWENQPGNIRNWIQDTKPDVVLMMIGGNDFFANNVRGDNTSNSLKESLSGIINNIFSLRPNATVIVTSIPPFKWDIQQGIDANKTKTTANAFLKQFVMQLSTSKKRIFFLDMHTAILAQLHQRHLFNDDGVHFNHEGNQFLAQHWTCALKTVIEGKSKPILPINCRN
jgi:hypothetical protein